MLAVLLPFVGVFAVSPAEERSQLERELQELESQIQRYEQDITKTQQEKKTLQNQIAIVKKQISKLDLQISQSNKIIGDLKVQIVDTTFSIDKTSRDVEEKKQQLGEILQRIYEEDQKTVLEILMTGSDLSEFFENLVALDSLNTKNRDLLLDIQDLNVYLQDQKVSLETDKQEEENFVKLQILQRQQSQAAKAEQEVLLQQTQGKEAEYSCACCSYPRVQFGKECGPVLSHRRSFRSRIEHPYGSCYEKCHEALARRAALFTDYSCVGARPIEDPGVLPDSVCWGIRRSHGPCSIHSFNLGVV